MKATAHTHDTLTGETTVCELDMPTWDADGFIHAITHYDAGMAGLPVEQTFGFTMKAWVPHESWGKAAAFVVEGRGPDRMLVAGIVYAE